jgi:hypothetical protein
LDGGSGGGWRTLVALTLPAGNYLVSAQATLRNGAADLLGVTCYLGDEDSQEIRPRTSVPGNFNDTQIAGQLAFALPSGGTIVWKCSAGPNQTSVTASLMLATLAAIPVASIN